MTSSSTGVKFTVNGENQDLIVYKGVTVDFIVEYKDSDDNIIDVTGYTAKLVAKEKSTGTTKIDWTNGSEITVNGSSGEFAVSVSATDTAALDVFAGTYDLHVTSPDGDTDKLLSGKCRTIGSNV